MDRSSLKITENNSFPTKLEAELSDSEFKSIVKSKYNGLIHVITADNELLVTQQKPLILAFHNFKKIHSQLEPWCNLLARVAKKYENHVNFAIADFNADLIIGMKLNKFNHKLLGPKSAPRIYAFDMHGNQFRMENFLNSSLLIEFIDLLLQGKLFISEPIPEIDDRKHLKTAVGYNLKNIVFNCEKDILLFFYERWTHYAPMLLTEFERLARLLKHENLTIFKINAEENHIPPEFNISSYPRCVYIQKGNKSNYIQYDRGSITIEGLIEFIALHSTTELKCCDRNGMLKEKLGYKTELHIESIETITLFIKENYNNLIRVLTDANEIKQTERLLVVAFHSFMRYNLEMEPWYDLIEEVAKLFAGKIDFAIADISLFSIDNQIYAQADFKATTSPTIYAFNTEGAQFKLDDEVSMESLKSFAFKLMNYEILTANSFTVKNFEPLVKVATRANFEELVLNSQENVFVAFYADWCCCTKSLLPTLNHLAHLLQEDRDQIVVKMNAAAERPPRYYTERYYPNIVYIKKGGEKRRNFHYHDYPRTAEKFIQFIAGISPNELKYYDRDGFLRKEYKYPYKELLYVNNANLSNPNAEFVDNQDDVQGVVASKFKLGNIISSAAFEGLLQLKCENLQK